MNCTAGRSSVPMLVTKVSKHDAEISDRVVFTKPVVKLTVLQSHGALGAVNGMNSSTVPQLGPRSQRDFHPVELT
jgi:hypothetical protein